MKKILVIILTSLLFCGCIHSTNNVYVDDDKVLMQSSDFNNEQYIWESFIFPSNKTTEK